MQRPGSESESQAVIPVAIAARTWVTGIALLAGAYLIWLTAAGALSALVLLFTGILVAVALRPIIDRLRVRMPFGAAVGAAFGAMVLIVALIAWVAIAPLGAELQRLFQAFPGYLNTLKGELATIERYVNNDRLSKQVAGSLANSAGGVVNSLGAQIVGSSTALVTLAGNAVIILLLAVGWALSCDQLESFVLSLLRRTRDRIGSRLSTRSGDASARTPRASSSTAQSSALRWVSRSHCSESRMPCSSVSSSRCCKRYQWLGQ